MIDLLLVNVPSRQRVYGLLTEFAAIEPPVWAGLIAGAARRAGFSVAILDAEAEKLTVAQTALRIFELQPRLAAFSIYGQQPSASTQCLPAASAVAQVLRGLPDRISTLAFGTHPSALPEKTLHEESFDFVAIGEATQTILSLLGKEQNSIAQYLGDVPGLWWQMRNGKACPVHAPQQNATALDAELPGQAWDLLDMMRYRAHNWHLWTSKEGHPIARAMRGPPCIWPKCACTGNTKDECMKYPTPGGYANVQTSLGCVYK